MPPDHIDYRIALEQAETFKTGHGDKRPAQRLAEDCIVSVTTVERCSEKTIISEDLLIVIVDYKFINFILTEHKAHVTIVQILKH